MINLESRLEGLNNLISTSSSSDFHWSEVEQVGGDEEGGQGKEDEKVEKGEKSEKVEEGEENEEDEKGEKGEEGEKGWNVTDPGRSRLIHSDAPYQLYSKSCVRLIIIMYLVWHPPTFLFSFLC